MKTLKTIAVLLSLLCCTLLTKAQIVCGINQVYFYQTVNPNQVYTFHDTTQLSANWQITGWHWDFGDGNSSTLQSPTHHYANNGTYTVCELVTATGNGLTCSDTFCRTVTVACTSITGNFTYTAGANGLVAFTSSFTSTYTPITYTWTFGDGSSGTGASPTHTYNVPGVYTVCVTATDANGCSKQVCNQIGITSGICGSANAAFNATANGGTVALASTSTGTNSGTLYQWFMDGTTLTNPNPNTAYTVTGVNTGTHTFCLLIYANANTFCDSTCSNIYVQNGTTGCGNLQASFTIAGTSSLVQLQSTSTNVPSGSWYQWYMDGVSLSPPSAGLNVFSVSNVASGAHWFCLSIYSAQNSQLLCDSTCQSFVVTNPNPCSGLTSSFTDSIHGNVGMFYGTSNSGSIVNLWSVNGVYSGTTQNFIYTFPTYPNTTTYMVCHKVSISGTNCVDSSCVPIIIQGSNPCSGVTAQFTQSYNSNGGVIFTSANSNSSAVYNWDFGDSHSSSQTSPTHYYSAGGLYTVCLTVHIAGTTCADTSCHQVQATTGAPCNGFTATVTSQPNPNGPGWYLTASTNSTSSFTSAWSNSSTTNSIFVTGAGVYCVTVNNVDGCSATVCDTLSGSACNMLATITATHTGSVYVLNAVTTLGTAPYSYHWSNGASTSNLLTVTASGTYCVTVYDNLQCSATACYTVQISGGCTDTICGIVFEDTNGNGVLDGTEHAFHGGYVYVSNSSQVAVDSFGHYVACVPAGTYNIYYCAQSGYTFTIPVGLSNPNNCAVYSNISIHGGGTHCGFDFGLQNNSSTICGTVYYDANNNHVFDSTETGIGNVVVLITGGGASFTGYTDQSGHYCVTVPGGVYTVHVQSNLYPSGSIYPTALTVTVTNGQTFNHNDFGVYTVPGACNLSISITPHTTVTPGFPAWYDIQVCNIGSNISSGTVSLFYDSHLTYSSSSPAATSQNSTTHTASWSLSNLTPGSCSYYWVTFDAPTSIAVGQFIFTLANVITTGCNDVDMSNNVDTIHQDATASWDPNNKLAYVTNHESDPNYQEVSSMNADQRIEYVINFQNTGTSPAVNIVVKDILSSDVDANSFELLGASHNMTATRTGNEINYKFNSILLPDATTDEANSHGWVKFAVNAVNGLVPGHVISDDAAIYFDYNAAVITNDAAVTLLDATGIEEVVSNATIIVAPNPMSQLAEFKLNYATATGFKLRLTDMTGRLVREEMTNSSTLIFDRSNLSAGVYTYQIIQANKLSAKGKLVVE